MQDDMGQVAAAIQQAFYEGGGYEGMARAAMAATLELAAEALRRPAIGFVDHLDVADWLQQRANYARAIGAP